MRMPSSSFIASETGSNWVENCSFASDSPAGMSQYARNIIVIVQAKPIVRSTMTLSAASIFLSVCLVTYQARSTSPPIAPGKQLL